MTEAYLLWLISAHFHLNICPTKTFTCRLVRQNICICIRICITVDNVPYLIIRIHCRLVRQYICDDRAEQVRQVHKIQNLFSPFFLEESYLD